MVRVDEEDFVEGEEDPLRRYLDAPHRRVLRAVRGRRAPRQLGGHAQALPRPPRDRARYTHYHFGMGPDVARVIDAYLDQPTSKAAQFTP
jgi:hypothetical protein